MRLFHLGDRSSLGLGLQKASAVICTSGLGALPELLNRRKLDHVVLLSSVGGAQANDCMALPSLYMSSAKAISAKNVPHQKEDRANFEESCMARY